MRYAGSQPNSFSSATGQRIVLFSHDPRTQQIARSFFAPLIAVIPGNYVYPDREQMSSDTELPVQPMAGSDLSTVEQPLIQEGPLDRTRR